MPFIAAARNVMICDPALAVKDMHVISSRRRPQRQDLLNWAAMHGKLYYEQTLPLSLGDLRRISCVIFAGLYGRGS
jgi:hypothetical protein